MEKTELIYTHNNTVANIILDDGKGNILDNIMMLEILNYFREFRLNPGIKLIVFQGAGKHFSFGASVEEHTSELAEMMIKTFHQIFTGIIGLGIPTAAKISGQCLGGGMELALMCNFLFADKSAKMGQPEIVLGVFPPPASILLPLKIGYARAEELLITGKIIGTDEAEKLGLLNYVYEDKEIMNGAFEIWVEENILPKSASSLRFGVKAARIKFNHILGNFLPQLEYLYVRELMASKDANEGINAFLEKRKPVWENG
jgi:cyclohexa-1,5-dienecarbonyl-CoA hydratase